jgi:hypothetical protein
MQEEETSLSNPPGTQTKSHLEDFLKKGQDTSSSTQDKSTTNTIEKQPSIEIGSPIMSLTPLRSSQANPNFEGHMYRGSYSNFNRINASFRLLFHQEEEGHS